MIVDNRYAKKSSPIMNTREKSPVFKLEFSAVRFLTVLTKPIQTPHFSVEYKTEGFVIYDGEGVGLDNIGRVA